MITVTIKNGQYEEYANTKSKKELMDFINKNNETEE